MLLFATENPDRILTESDISWRSRFSSVVWTNDLLPWPLGPLSRASRATAARARRVRCDELEQKIARLWNTSPPHNPAARQVTPSTMNIFESGSRCAAASAAVHGAAAALISPRTPPTRAPPRPHATCALLSHPPPVCAARRSRSAGAALLDSADAAPMELERVRAGGAVSGVRGGPDGG